MPRYDFKCELCTLSNAIFSENDTDSNTDAGDEVSVEENDVFDPTKALELTQALDLYHTDYEAFKERIRGLYPITFEVELGMNDEKKAVCPYCESETTIRSYHTFATHEGLTAAQKGSSVGGVATMRRRIDQGRFMKQQRDQRKKDFGPDTHEGFTNEYWVPGAHSKETAKSLGMSAPSIQSRHIIKTMQQSKRMFDNAPTSSTPAKDGEKSSSSKK